MKNSTEHQQLKTKFEKSILKHTENQTISIFVISGDGTTRASIVEVIPLKEGETEVSIILDIDCEYF